MPKESQPNREKYETLRPLLDGLYRDVRALAARRQDGALAKPMIAMINKLLTEILELLSDEPARQFLTLLDEGAIPRNSDAMILLGQFQSAMESYYKSNTVSSFDDEERTWKTRGKRKG